MKQVHITLAALAIGAAVAGVPLPAMSACDHSWQTDSMGRSCGGRAASVRPGGRLGGDGHYTDPQGRPRVYGRNNDPYDRGSSRSRRSSRYGYW